MHLDWQTFYTWLFGVMSGIPVQQIIGRWWERRTQNSDRVRIKKDAIGQEFYKIYLEGKSHGFVKPPLDDDHIRRVIIAIEKYDMELSNKLAECRHYWTLRSSRVAYNLSYPQSITKDAIKDMEEWRIIAEHCADEVYKEIKRKW